MKEINVLKRILFCTDFSASADAAFGYACGIARASGGRIVAMHVVTSTYEDPEYVSFVTPDLRAQVDDGIRGRVERELQDRYTAQCPADTPCEVLVVKGKPAEKILDVAAREEIDLIILGSRGQTAMGHLFLGSVAHRVSQGSRVPVLLVPASS
jgi:nucleotide-binding universal stress UspA family protein